ncbi:MAG: hypothetical protein ACLR3T_00130 [Alistipes finegoldii]
MRTSVGVGDAVRFAEHQQTGKCQSLDLSRRSIGNPSISLEMLSSAAATDDQGFWLRPAGGIAQGCRNILLDGKFGQILAIAGMFCDISVGDMRCISLASPKVSS